MSESDYLDDLRLMRQALEAVEWAAGDDGDTCPWCGGQQQWEGWPDDYREWGHKTDCLRQRALGLAKTED